MLHFNISQLFAVNLRSTVIISFSRWTDPQEDYAPQQIRTAFQVRIQPGTYDVGPQTVGASKPIDPEFRNEELEWSTKRRAVTVLVGLLIKIEGVEESPHLSVMARIAKKEPALMQSKEVFH